MDFKDTTLVIENTNIHIYDSECDCVKYVMMEWETPLMEKHSEIVCSSGGDILEIGFGMGISANYIYNNPITSHTIVENHPQIIELIKSWMVSKDNVTLIEGDWFDKQETIKQKTYDGIFYDAHRDPNILDFRNLIVDNVLNIEGVFTYFQTLGVDYYNYGEELNIMEVEVEPIANNYFPININIALLPWYKRNI